MSTQKWDLEDLGNLDGDFVIVTPYMIPLWNPWDQENVQEVFLVFLVMISMIRISRISKNWGLGGFRAS